MHLQINRLNWSVTRKAILTNINMTVKHGQFVGLIGANGSGKSSLLRCAYRRYQPDSGQILLNNVDMHTLSAKYIAQHVAVVLQELPAEFGFTVKEVIAMGLTPHQGLFSNPITTHQQRIDDALHKVNLTACKNQSFDLLSGGEKQRCLLARALVQQPQLLILDEPTNHLDIHYQYELLDLITSLGISVLCTLHDLNIAARYCDHLYLINEGEIVMQGLPSQVLTAQTLQQYFSMDAIVHQQDSNDAPHIRYVAPIKSPTTAYKTNGEKSMMNLFNSMFKYFRVITLLVPSMAGAATSIDVCGNMVDYPNVPTRAVTNDVNMLKIMLALGLKDNMVAYAGVTAYNTTSPALAAQITDLPEIAKKLPSVENLLNIDADFFFSGWNYGMPVGGPTTPQSLAQFGIKTYLIKESCAHVQKKTDASLNDTFYDIRALGKIFAIESRAEALVSAFEQRLSAIEKQLNGVDKKTVFVYDSGIDKPFTSGKLATPNAIIAAAGGVNILADVAVSWGAVSWESIIDANPQHIVVINYDSSKAEDNIAFLKHFPITANLTAVQQNRFTIIDYTAATPGIENVDAIEKLAQDLHPQRFQ